MSQLTPLPVLNGELSGLPTLSGVLSKDIIYPSYNGSYEIVPKPFRDREFQTENKLMEKDLVVKQIPFYSFANESGETIYIG